MLAFEVDPRVLSMESKNGPSIPTEAEAILKHMEGIKPINVAIRAFQKRKTKRSTGSLSSKDARLSQTGFDSKLSLNDFYASHSNTKGKSSSKSSLKKEPILTYQISPRTIEQKLLQLDHTIQELRISQLPSLFQLESLPLEKLSDKTEIKKRAAVIAKYRMKKFNSTSTLFIDSCLVNSEIEEHLK